MTTEPTGDPLPSVTVVIPTRDRLDVIEKTLSAVLDDPATVEVIVMVDRGDEATRETRELLDRLGRDEPRLRAMRTPSDTRGLWSVQHARDVGVEAARSEVVLALDDDVVLGPGVVSGHARAHTGGSGRVIVGYMPVVASEPWPRSNAPIRHYSEAYESHCKSFEAEPDSILLSLWGGNVSIRREGWLRAIERPRTKCWGHDDKELGLLFLREGLVGSFDPDLHGDHWYRRSLRGFVVRAERASVSQARLRAANSDLLGAPAPQQSSRRRRLFAPLLWLSRSSLGWFFVRWAFIGIVAATAALRLRSAEDAAARHLWFMASERSLWRAAKATS